MPPAAAPAGQWSTVYAWHGPPSARRAGLSAGACDGKPPPGCRAAADHREARHRQMRTMRSLEMSIPRSGEGLQLKRRINPNNCPCTTAGAVERKPARGASASRQRCRTDGCTADGHQAPRKGIRTAQARLVLCRGNSHAPAACGLPIPLRVGLPFLYCPYLLSEQLSCSDVAPAKFRLRPAKFRIARGRARAVR